MNIKNTAENIVPYIKPMLIGSAIGGIAGAYGGAIIGANNAHGVEETQIGSAVGMVGGAALGIGTVKAASNFASTALNTLESVGGATISGFEKIGGLAIKSAPYIGKAGVSIGTVGATLGAVATEKYASAGLGFASKLVKEVPMGSKNPGIFGQTLSGLGIATVLGTGLIASAKEGYDQIQEKHMGSRSQGIYKATPQVPAYANNGGATGDLVFALNQNR